MDLAPAPFFDNEANSAFCGPPGGAAWWVDTSDDLRIRVGMWITAWACCMNPVISMFTRRHPGWWGRRMVAVISRGRRFHCASGRKVLGSSRDNRWNCRRSWRWWDCTVRVRVAWRGCCTSWACIWVTNWKATTQGDRKSVV